MSITSEVVRQKAASPETYRRAEALCREGSVDIRAVDTFWKGEVDVKAMVADTSNAYAVNLLLKGSRIYDYTCACSLHRKYRGMCEHTAAAALAYIRQAEELRIANVSTSRAIREMLHKYEDEKLASVRAMQYTGQVEIEPYVTGWRSRLQVEFRIGMHRKYVMKDLYEFACNMEGGEEVNYGKHLQITHVPEVFTKDSAQLADFIKEQAQYQHGSADPYRFRSDSQSRRELLLNKRATDVFMNFLIGKEVQFPNDGGYYKAKMILDKDPEITVTIRAKGKNGATIMLPEELQAFSGEKHLYLVTPTAVYHCSEEYSEALGTFFISILNSSYIGAHEQDMNQKDYAAFCAYILPKLRMYTIVNCQDISFDSYTPMPLVTRFRVDSPVYNEVTLEVIHSYGDVTFHPMEEPEEPVFRDTAIEQAVEQTVTRYFKNRYADNSRFSIVEDEDAIYEFLTEGIKKLEVFGEVFISETMKNVTVRTAPKVKTGVRVADGWLKLRIDTDGIPSQELKNILESYRQKKKYYRLKNGDFLSLQDSSLDTLQELSEGLFLKGKDFEEEELTLSANRAYYLRRVLGEQTDKGFQELLDKIEHLEKYPVKIPERMDPILREYQKTGFRWLYALDTCHFGGILADDMGLGKTLQMISLLVAEKERDETSVSLIVCPASLVYNWEHELTTFAPELKAVSVVGTSAERQEILEHYKEYQVLVTSYDLLKRDLPFYEGKSFRFQTIDEAQVIKNFNTQSARAVKEIQAATKFALTGTPIENRLSELWSIFDYLMPGFLFTYHQFRGQFETPIVKKDDKEVLKRLHNMIAPFILRRLKKDVLTDLPDKLEKVIYSRLEGEQKKLYAASALRLKESLEQETENSYQSNKLQVLTELTRLRQICCDPRLVFEGYRETSAKLETCMELIETGVAAGHKILLFSQFTSMFPLVEKRLKKEKIKYFCLTGATKKEDRMAMVNSFNEDDTSVFLISLKAGGTGLNLTAADVVIHYDPWWNVAAQNQATDRAHRIGQERVVTVFKLIAKRTVEENILKLQEAKRDLAEQIIGGESVAFGSLSKEELLKIL